MCTLACKSWGRRIQDNNEQWIKCRLSCCWAVGRVLVNLSRKHCVQNLQTETVPLLVLLPLTYVYMSLPFVRCKWSSLHFSCKTPSMSQSSAKIDEDPMEREFCMFKNSPQCITYHKKTSAITQAGPPKNILVSSMYDELFTNESVLMEKPYKYDCTGRSLVWLVECIWELWQRSCCKVTAVPTLPFNLDLKLDDAYGRSFIIVTCLELGLSCFPWRFPLSSLKKKTPRPEQCSVTVVGPTCRAGLDQVISVSPFKPLLVSNSKHRAPVSSTHHCPGHLIEPLSKFYILCF